MIKYQLLDHEDELKLDKEFPERPRGGIGTLVRAILDVNERNDVSITIHRAFMASSYYNNPSALAQQSGDTHAHIKAWRDGDVIHIRASQADFASARSWTGQLAEKLRELPETNPDGGIPFMDVPWSETPITYQQIPSLVPRRTNPHLTPHRCEVKACQKHLRVWLFRATPVLKSRSRKPSKAVRS